ncbi:hypothetical protein SLNSH_19110 [Alsobacter soli]|uniref:Uncharacterized protein n=1 Tax=Alsobacter soli TaxID=2109933 RepID=A0A2T1HNZ2_9HYPH|nr:hypothetical protein [Alsobacter soli]PSC03378.1 hypothetical protein SLNSH_19110 [Alsobacter soli]
MRRMIILAGALACLPMAAHAQSDGRDWDRRGDWMQQTGDRGDWRDSSDRDRFDRGRGMEESRDARSGWRDQGRSRDGEDEDHGRGGMGMGMDHEEMMRMHHRMMRQGMGMGMGGMGRAGASFMLRAGDVRLGVRCSPSETMKACVDAATDLMDRAKTLSTGGMSGSSSTTAPSTSGSGAGTPGSTSPGTGGGAAAPKP